MKRLITILFIMVLVFSCLDASHADNPLTKLAGGIMNVAMSPHEVFKSIVATNEEEGAYKAWTWGPVKGLFNGVSRMVAGIYEVATFPIPVPKYYEPVWKNPESF